MILDTKYIRNLFVLLPFILVIIAEIASFRNQSLGAFLKLFAASYMLLHTMIFAKFDKKIVISFTIFLPFLIYHIFISFSLVAAFEESIRYLFPIIVLFYGFSVKRYYMLIINFIIAFAILNNLYQIINYYYWFIGVNEQWFYYQVEGQNSYYYNSTIGIIRGVGLMGFFAAYGFLNLIAYFLTKQFYSGKYKKIILTILILGVISSLSFKAIGVFALLMFLFTKHKTKLFFVSICSFLISLIFFPKKIINFNEQLNLRIKTYITEGNSARAESYFVMLGDFADFRLLGRGVGSFGGAASTKYSSPIYEEVNFNWYETTHLATTDTYYPHAFVEMGIVGGVLYFTVLFSPLIKRYYRKEILLILFVIYFSIFFDSLFSFALNNLGYLMVSLILIYPILYYEKKVTIKKF